MKSPEMMPSEPVKVGGMIESLIRKYGNPSDSKRHAQLANEIKDAISKKDKDELLKKLSNFGNARNDEASARMQMVEMFCYQEAKKIMDLLEGMDEVPWDEIAKSNSVNGSQKKAQMAEKAKKELSKQDIENAADFLDDFVLDNDDLSDEVKSFIIRQVKSEIGPWSVKNFVKSISVDGNKITINNKQGGAAFLYME